MAMIENVDTNIVLADNELDDDINKITYEDEEYESSDEEENVNQIDRPRSNRGLTRLSKFRGQYDRPGFVKYKVTFDALNRVTGLNRSLFSSFLGDVVRDNIGLKVLSWKEVNKESRQKLWDEVTKFFDVDVALKKVVMTRLGKLLRNFRRKLMEKYILPNEETPSKLNERPEKYSTYIKVEEWVAFVTYTTSDEYKEKSEKAKLSRSKNIYDHKMGRGGYACVKENMIKNKEIEADEEPPRGVLWIKGRQKEGESPDDEISSLADKLKEADEKIKEGTLEVDGGTDAMTVVFGKEKGGYARGVGNGVTYKSYFNLPRRGKETDERLELLQTQLDTERQERKKKDLLVKQLSKEMEEKDVVVKNLSKEMEQTKGVLDTVLTMLKANGMQLNIPSGMPVDSDVTTPTAIDNVDISANDVADGTQSSVGVGDKDATIQKQPKGLGTLESVPIMQAVKSVKTIGYTKTLRPRQTGSTDSQSHGTVSPTPALQAEPVKTAAPKKTTPKQRRNRSTDSHLQESVSPTQGETTIKCKLKHLENGKIVATGHVYKSNGKQMLHNQPLPNDCYKVSIESSIVDAAFIPDVANNGKKTVKDGISCFLAWPKDLVVIQEEVTPPTTIPKISEKNPGLKIPTKRKHLVSSESLRKQAANAKIQKTLDYGI